MYLYGQSDIEPYTGYNCHMYKDEWHAYTLIDIIGNLSKSLHVCCIDKDESMYIKL